MNIYRVSPWKAFLAIAIALTLACDGCTSVQLVADYNKKIDNGVTELQKKTDTFLARVVISPDSAYASRGRGALSFCGVLRVS